MKRRPLTGDEAKPDSLSNFIFDEAQGRQHELSETTLTAADIDEREIKLQKVSGVVKIVTKLDGTIYSVTLS